MFYDKEGGTKIDTIYDEELMKIPFYRIHKSYLPFIGGKYKEFKILQVAESHYIEQGEGNIKFYIRDFHDNWWNDKDLDFTNKLNCPKNIDTRIVAGQNFCDGGRKSRAYGVFRNPLQVFEKIKNLERKDNNYNYFAFMNFFQMPALVRKMGFWKSLETCRGDWENGEEEVWKETCIKSVEIFDAVVDIIKPNLIIFTSKSAYNAYNTYDGKYKDKVKNVDHPCSIWWHKRKKNGLKNGKEKFTDILNDLNL